MRSIMFGETKTFQDKNRIPFVKQQVVTYELYQQVLKENVRTSGYEM